MLPALKPTPKKRHRADYASPVPPDLRDEDGWPTTWYARYLQDLVDHFGPDEVATWDSPRTIHITEELVRFRCAGAVFHARRERGHWMVYEGGHTT